MFYALATSTVIELAMYLVYVLAIRDGRAVDASSSPIQEILTQQAGGAVAKIIVAVALTNIMACLLANILVATRLTYSMSRDNMLPLSHIWRHVSPTRRTPTYAVIGLAVLSTALLLSALVNLQAFNYILGVGSLAFFVVYILQTVGLIIGSRRGTVPVGEPGLFDLGRYRMPLYLVAVVVFTAVATALVVLPQFAGNGLVFLGVTVVGSCGGRSDSAADCDIVSR